MCDPVTLATTALAFIGGASTSTPNPPAPELPALDVREAETETGADIILGNEVDEDADEYTSEDTKVSNRVTSGSGLSTGSRRSGVSIL